MFLIKDNDKYIIKSDRYSVVCNLNDMVTHMTERLGVDFNELNEALSTMRNKGHDRANFGLGGTFIFSDKQESLSKLKAELRATAQLRREFGDVYLVQGKTPETDAVFSRLVSLYSALDVESLLTILERN